MLEIVRYRHFIILHNHFNEWNVCEPDTGQMIESDASFSTKSDAMDFIDELSK